MKTFMGQSLVSLAWHCIGLGFSAPIHFSFRYLKKVFLLLFICHSYWRHLGHPRLAHNTNYTSRLLWEKYSRFWSTYLPFPHSEHYNWCNEPPSKVVSPIYCCWDLLRYILVNVPLVSPITSAAPLMQAILKHQQYILYGRPKSCTVATRV